jgi:cyclopropane fatty-acyl-phospholipid synthase-like methyltransferase
MVGGHCYMTNEDWGALAFMVKALQLKSMVDVGCGTGGMVHVARKLGLESYGIDGDPNVLPEVLHDFYKGSLEIEKVDLAWSVEFLEHIKESYLDNVFSVFNKCKYVFCTKNPNEGKWHTNCNDHMYWLKIFNDRGFRIDEPFTKQIKQHSTMEREFVKDTGAFFVNESYVSR